MPFFFIFCSFYIWMPLQEVAVLKYAKAFSVGTKVSECLDLLLKPEPCKFFSEIIEESRGEIGVHHTCPLNYMFMCCIALVGAQTSSRNNLSSILLEIFSSIMFLFLV